MSCEQTTFSLVLVKMPTGKRLKSQTNEVVVHVYDYLEELSRYKCTQGPLKRTADATGLSRASIKRLRKEKVDTGGAAFSTPTKRYRFSRRLLVDDFDREAIRRKIYHLYQAKEHVTLTKLLLLLKRYNLFDGQRSTLNILLKEMGFKRVTKTFVMMTISILFYRHKRVDDRRHYYEQPHIIEQRHAYLRQMRTNRQKNRPVVYLD